MAGYYPSMNYDPSNPTAWNQATNMAPAGDGRPQTQMYGPMRSNLPSQSYMPNVGGAPSFMKFGGQSGSSRTNIYVSGFPTSWTSSDLRNLFKGYGTVTEIKVITKPSTEENRGVAFVHFSKNSSAAKAIEEVKDTIPHGCAGKLTMRFANANKNVQPEFMTMRVSVARFQPQGWSLESSLNLYVSQLPAEITEAKLRPLFESFGVIKSMRLSKNNNRGAIAFVHYESPEEATKAVAEMDEYVLDGSPTTLRVRFANVNKANIPDWFNLDHLKNMQTTTNVYVSQIPPAWTEENLKSFFGGYGEILDAKVLNKKEANGGAGFVHFEKSISACKSVAFKNDTLPEEGAANNILVTFARLDNLTHEKLLKNTFPMAGMMNNTMRGPAADSMMNSQRNMNSHPSVYHQQQQTYGMPMGGPMAAMGGAMGGGMGPGGMSAGGIMGAGGMGPGGIMGAGGMGAGMPVNGMGGNVGGEVGGNMGGNIPGNTGT